MGLDHLDAVLQGLRTCAAQVADGDCSGAGQGAVVDHQFVAGRVVAAQYTLHPQLAAIACVIALHGQGVAGAGIAAAEIDGPGVVQGGMLASGERRDAALGGRYDAAAVDVERAAAGDAVAEHDVTVDVEPGAIAQADSFPVDVTGGAGGCGVIKG
ncbi:hypothetical protein D3C86_1648880 [compost metagenome]